MTPDEATTVFLLIASINPSQRFHQKAPEAWAEVLPDVSLEDAIAAVKSAARSEDFITPASILRHKPDRSVKAITAYRYHDE